MVPCLAIRERVASVEPIITAVANVALLIGGRYDAMWCKDLFRMLLRVAVSGAGAPP